MSRINKYEPPITKFLDEENFIIVKLISYPDPKMTERVLVNTCYGHSDPDIYDKLDESKRIEAINTIISGGSLPKGLEMTGKFIFLINNIPLTATHMFIRHRFFTILQKSTAVDDIRNEDFVMPRSFAKDDVFYKKIKKWYLMGKELYCDAVDTYDMSVQNARLFIPKNNCNHMYMGFDLKAFSEAYSQRMCENEEPIQSNIVFGKMRDEILNIFPYFEPYFRSSCETGKCLHSKTGKHANIVFKRNELHKKFLPKDYDLSKEDTLHDKTRNEMNEGPEITSEKYIGFEKQNAI